MLVNTEVYRAIVHALKPRNITLVAVSKTKPIAAIEELYNMGQRDFGENYVQELVDKQLQMPQDVRWHFIGHLQSNKVKLIAPFVQLIHGVDSFKLLKEIDKQAQKHNRKINVLLQVHIAQEETKFGMDETEIADVMNTYNNNPSQLSHINICGLMGMASFTEKGEQVRKEFHFLKSLFDKYPQLHILSMGMSGDYEIAVEEGTTMVRIGSLIFGSRTAL